MKLMREFRCFPHGPTGGDDAVPAGNKWAGTVCGDPVGAYHAIRIVVEGPVDEHTGYSCDIGKLELLIRRHVVRGLTAAGVSTPCPGLSDVAGTLLAAFTPAAADTPKSIRLVSLRLDLSPHTYLSVESKEPTMVNLTQSFEFSAAHVLRCPDFTDEANRRTFGKCGNPNGHGHNYVLQVTISGTPDSGKGTVIDLPHLDRVVRERVIEPLDHKNLNIECPEFASLNPTVENIARVIWDRLVNVLGPRTLSAVRVWETPKTFAEYTGQG